jgi:NAD(P)H-dependent FMN reductase
MKKLFIPILVGTTREARKSIHAAKLIEKLSNSFESVTTEFIDPLDFNFPGDGNDPAGKDPRYSNITKRADAFFIVTPEYNHSFPGSLKRMLDSELQNYVHKPVAFAGVSSGPWGGVRAIESLVLTVREMGMITTFADVQFPRIQDIFDEKGTLLDDVYVNRVNKAWVELIWMTQAIQLGIQNIPSKYHEKA